MKRISETAGAVLLVCAGILSSGAGHAAESVRQVSLYADVKARDVGDIVTVAIVERASGSNVSRLTTQRNTQFEVSGKEGTGALDFFPEMGMSAKTDREHDGSGQLSRQGELTATMAAVVVKVLPNGNLEIEGEREVGINEEKEILTLHGIVRPEDIGPGNVVFSTDIADARIDYKGKGIVTGGSRPNILARILSVIF